MCDRKRCIAHRVERTQSPLLSRGRGGGAGIPLFWLHSGQGTSILAGWGWEWGGAPLSWPGGRPRGTSILAAQWARNLYSGWVGVGVGRGTPILTRGEAKGYPYPGGDTPTLAGGGVLLSFQGAVGPL